MHRILSLISSSAFQDLCALAAVTLLIYGASKFGPIAEALILAGRIGQ